MGIIGKISRIFSGSKRTQWRTAQLEEIGRKMDMCSDVSVKAAAQELMTALGGKGARSRASRQAINRAEHLLDSVNTAEGQYCTLYHELLPNSFRPGKRQTYSAVRQSVLYRPYLAESPNLGTATRMSSIKRYISAYPEDAKMCSHLYERYYLSTLDAETSKFLREIDADFGVKIFMDKPLSKPKLLYIKEELELARKAGGDLVKYPPLIDVTDFDPFITKFFGAKGLSVNYKFKPLDATTFGKRVALQEEAVIDTSLRHEFIGHYNDRNFTQFDWMKFLPKKNRRLNPRYEQELRNAGCDEGSRMYAATNRNERIAVSMQGDISKYSARYIQELKKEGAAPFLDRLEMVDMEKFIPQFFTDKKSLATLGEIRQALGGKIPNNVCVMLMERPDKLDVAHTLMKIKGADGQMRFGTYFPDLLDIEPARLQTVKKFANLSVNGVKNPYDDFLGTFISQHEFTPAQLEKLYLKAEKAAQKGEIFEFDKFFERYFTRRYKFEEKQALAKASENLFGNVTNITVKTI